MSQHLPICVTIILLNGRKCTSLLQLALFLCGGLFGKDGGPRTTLVIRVTVRAGKLTTLSSEDEGCIWIWLIVFAGITQIDWLQSWGRRWCEWWF